MSWQSFKFSNLDLCQNHSQITSYISAPTNTYQLQKYPSIPPPSTSLSSSSHVPNHWPYYKLLPLPFLTYALQQPKQNANCKCITLFLVFIVFADGLNNWSSETMQLSRVNFTKSFISPYLDIYILLHIELSLAKNMKFRCSCQDSR